MTNDAELPRAPSILHDAHDLIHGERQSDYGHPSKNFDRLAKLWSVVLGTETTPDQVVLCLVALKLARTVENPNKRDSWLDMAGYIGIWEMLHQDK